MADSKISALPASTVPLAGTEVLPIVQSSTTKQVSVANLTAGRSVSVADLAVSTGNIVPGTAAKGINFTANTPAAGMTSQLLNWYEEGTWVPVLKDSAGNSATMTSPTCSYTRVGRLVTVLGQVSTSSVAALSGALFVHGLPFTCKNGDLYYSAGSIGNAGGLTLTAGQCVAIFAEPNTKFCQLNLWDATTGTTQLLKTEWSNTGSIIFNLSYVAA